MKRRYVAIRPFKNITLGKVKVGRVIKHKELKHLSREEISKYIYIQDFSDVVLPFNFGLIFLSKEFPHPEGEEEETREQVIERLICEMQKCCCGSGKPFLKNGKCTECDKCKEC